mgnify:CR=1 FL=1
MRYILKTSLVGEYKLLAEVDHISQIEELTDDIAFFIHIIYVASLKKETVYNYNKAQRVKSVKFVDDDSILWFDVRQLTISSVQDPLYEKDKEVI